MKKAVRTSLLGIAAVAATAVALPMQANAAALQFSNLDGAGTPGAFLLVDKLNSIASINPYLTQVDVGADKTLSNGDTFSESLVLITNSSNYLLNPTSFALGGDYKLVAALTGTIYNTMPVALGGAINLNPDNSVSIVNGGVVFDVSFSTASIELRNNQTNALISTLGFVSGGGSSIQLVAGSLISDITLNALLNCTATCDPYVKLDSGASAAGVMVDTITTGSARFNNFLNGNYAANTFDISFSDNGQSTTFIVPEPGAIALLGMGLVGFAATGRRKKVV